MGSAAVFVKLSLCCRSTLLNMSFFAMKNIQCKLAMHLRDAKQQEGKYVLLQEIDVDLEMLLGVATRDRELDKPRDLSADQKCLTIG